MEREILITDLTAMGGDRVCIAGIDLKWNTIRPVFAWTSPTRSHLFQGSHTLIRPRAVVAMKLEAHANPVTPHVEDHIWTRPYSARYVKLLDEANWQKTLHGLVERCPRPLFGAALHSLGRDRNRIVRPGDATHSLTTVRCARSLVFRLSEKDGGGFRYALSFYDDQSEVYQNIPVTDLGLRAWATVKLGQGESLQPISDWLGRQLNAAQHVYLRLGLTREYEGKFWLQVNGVYSFPDWLEGRCFADFADAP
ncbi:MAG: hypothetical protein OXB89_00470 [Anaerolineaceae bacterium]|nr:hypothetical protein [Anaerolineaceae bacterium]